VGRSCERGIVPARVFGLRTSAQSTALKRPSDPPGSKAVFPKFVKAMRDLGSVEDIRSLGAIMNRIVEIVTVHVNEKKPAESTETPRVE
jgi:hypothetical protein